MPDPNDIRTKLNAHLGFDPGKESGPTSEVLKRIIEEEKKVHQTKAEDKARELVRKAMEISSQAAKVDKDYQKAKAAVDKELSKLYNQINAALTGGQQPAAEEAAQPADGNPAEPG